MWRDLLNFIKISRPLNVLISFLSFAVGCYLVHDKSLRFLGDLPFWGTGLTIAVIAATGYWINDVYDFRIDRVNRPRTTIVNAKLSVKKVLTVYFVTNMAILMFSLAYLGWHLGMINITFINFVSVLMLFVYASWLKRVSVAGNLVISFMIALVLILAYYLYHEINLSLIWAIVFAFEITLIREITKDVQDIRGDLQFSLRTLPIQIGITQTRKVLLALYLIFLLSTYLPFVEAQWRMGQWLWPYLALSVLLVQLPCLYLIRLMWRSEEPEDFGIQSNMLKVLMLTGLITLFFLR
ncbi:MAG: geranylgeranylglycerol-phosphate geranylgeranyltransferase [Bacteroidota bacterium]